MILQINGVTIKNPTKWKIERYNLTKSGRVATGDMVMDIVAKKLKFFLEYKYMTGDELKKVTELLFGDNPFVTLTYEEHDEIKTATVYAGPLSQELFRRATIGDHTYWVGIQFNLIQQ